MQDNSKYLQILKKITKFDLKVKIHCVLLSHKLLSIIIYYTSIIIFYILFIARQVQKSRHYENPTSTSKDTYKTIFIILFQLFSIGDSFEFKTTRETRLI